MYLPNCEIVIAVVVLQRTSVVSFRKRIYFYEVSLIDCEAIPPSRRQCLTHLYIVGKVTRVDALRCQNVFCVIQCYVEVNCYVIKMTRCFNLQQL